MNFEENPPPHSFQNDLYAIFKKYPNSQKDIETELSNLAKKPMAGNAIPGFSPNQIRKLRIPLKKYNIGKSNGLRIIYLVDPRNNRITKLHIYCKKQYRGEQEVKENVRNALKELKGEQTLPLERNPCPHFK